MTIQTMPQVTHPTTIEVRGLAKRYGRRRIFENVGFTVPRGALVGIEGENGAGKSTLLKCLVGLLKPDAGTVALHGRMGYCPQEPLLADSLTAREHFTMFGAGYGLSARETAWRSERLMETFRCDKYARTRVDRMSGGSKQKINLIVALLHQPDVLVLDEPYQGFDYETYQIFWAYAERYCQEGGSVVVVSHMHTEKHRFTTMLKLADGTLTETRIDGRAS
ncbi:ABC transporter ATP-binding protein [Spirillospora sp. CA-255316]